MVSATCRNIKGIAEARVRYHIIRWNLDWLWCRRCSHSNATIRVFLGLQGFETGIGLFEGLVHVLW